MRKVDENWFGNVVDPNEIDVAVVIYNLLTLEKLWNCGLYQRYSTFFVRVPPDIISLQLFTPKFFRA
jgi:hypothetical protein